ncbi:MAG: amidohydrolase family protein [Actinomycetota bacterium]
MRDGAIIDGDQHLYEPRTMWRDHIDPGFRDDALAVELDELGYAWLTWRGQRLYPAEIQQPAKAKEIGELRKRMERGERAEASYDELLPVDYTSPKARVDRLDEWGLDAVVTLPNYGLIWEDLLSADVPALCANLRAHNRWMAEAQQEGGGRLFGVAHLTLRDRDWVLEELRTLGEAGVKLAMTAPAPVDGAALSDPSLDPVWAAFVEHDVAPIFHVGNFRQPFDPAWYAGDPEPVDKLLASTFLWVAPSVAIASMIAYGALERHPGLRIGVIEMTASWVPEVIPTLEGAWGFYASRHGGPMMELSLPPSAYFFRHVRVGAMGYEQPGRLIDMVGEDVFMFGSDWPHAEGLAEPLRGYERFLPDDLPETARRKLFGDNIRWLLNV